MNKIVFLIFLLVCGGAFADGQEKAVSEGTRLVEISPGVSMAFVWVEPGSFEMGSADGEADSTEKPVHKVTLTKGYWLGQFEVTQAEWQSVMGDSPSLFKGDRLPVECVSRDYCMSFINRINGYFTRMAEAWRVRLPTEAEWEFAARGGVKGKGYKYSGSDDVDEVAWFRDNSGNRPHEVGTKKANELGLYDMSGNVWEWCQDRFWDYFYDFPVVNPSGPSWGEYVVNRGGGWYSTATGCRSSFRNQARSADRVNNLGLRLVLEHL